MITTRLDLYNFRNYKQASILLAPGVNIFIGKNAQGKTNLIEAIALLSIGKSFRAAKTKELIGWNAEQASVTAKVESEHGNTDLRVELLSRGRNFYINDDKVKKLQDVLGKLLAVSFSPRDLHLVHGGPQERRSFTDKLLVQLYPQIYSDLAAYQQALANKRSLFKTPVVNNEELRSWNAVLAKHATPIINKRYQLINELGEKAARIFSQFSPETPCLSYVSDIKESFLDKEELSVEDVLSVFREKQEIERIQRRCLIGPQRDDLEFSINSQNARVYASQGQARSLVLACLLASVELLEERHHDTPLILLDDVNSELDKERSTKFFDLLFEKKRQTLVTGTELSLAFIKPRAEAVFEIQDGEIKA